MDSSAANSRFFRIFAHLMQRSVVLALPLLAGCSLGLFSDGRDQAVLSQKPYREGNPLCANVDIRSNGVSVPQFRELLACLNSNGSLAEIQKLTDQMGDDELLPLVRVGNEKFFKNAVYLYRFEKSFDQWVKGGTLEADFDAMGGLLRNERWLQSVLALMAKADPKLYPALEIAAREIDPAAITRTLEAITALVESPAFRSLQAQLMKPGADALSVDELAASVMSYIRAQRAPGRVDIDRRVLKALADGSLFQVLDDFSLSLSPAGDLRETVAKFSALSNQLSARESGLFGLGARHDAEKLRDLLGLVNGMHAPISCFKGTQVVPDGVMFVLRELSGRSTRDADHFLRRENLLNLSLLNSFCEFPQALSKHYSALQSLSSTDTLFTAVEFSKAFYRNGSADLLVDILGGEGTGTGVHSSQMSPMLELLPLLSELTSRGAMEDLYLVSSLIRPEDRPQWQQFFGLLVQQRAELDGQSIYDVLYDTFSRADEALLADLMEGFRNFMAADGDVFGPAMRSLRHSLLMNNVHPILDVVLDLLRDPAQNRDFFEAIFKMARRHPSEFEAAIGLLGDMTRADDGRMKDVVGAAVRVFSKFAQTGASAVSVEPREVPVLDASRLRAHSWSRSDLFPVVPQLLPEWKGCSTLSPTARLDQYEDPAQSAALDSYLLCLDSDGRHSEMAGAIDYLRGEKTSTGKPLLNHWIDGIRALSLSPDSIRVLVREFFDLYDQGTLFRAIDVLPWWLNHDFAGRAGDPTSTLISPLIDLIGGVVRGAGDSVARAEKFAGQALSQDAFPGAVAFVRSATREKPAVTPFTDSVSFPLPAFSGLLWQYECRSRPSDVAARADQLVGDYRDAVTGWEVDAGGNHRRAWSKKELRGQLAPIAQKLADPAQGPVAEKLVDFLKMMALEPGEVPSAGRLHHWSELRAWLADRSDDWQLIPYFYPGEENPRLKMGSSLDFFEMLVINADFKFVTSENYALKFLGLVAQAWGDEPRELWPAEIREKFARGGRPQTLREAFNDIKSTQKLAEGLLGLPDLPDCPSGRMGQGFSLVPLHVRARVFNMKQLLSVIERNLPDAQGPYRGGMKVFRDLLYQLWSSTPSKDRGTGAGWKNNLSLGASFARLGVFRQLSRGARLALLQENQGEAAGGVLLDHLVEAVVKGAGQPSAAGAANGIFRNDPGNEFFFSLHDAVYDLLSVTDGRDRIHESLLYGAAVLRQPGLAEGLVNNAAIAFWNHRPEVLAVLPGMGELLASQDLATTLHAFDAWRPESQDDLDARRDFDRLATGALGASVDGQPLSLDLLRILGVMAGPENRGSWKEFSHRKSLAEQAPEYAALDVPGMVDQAFGFFSERDSRTAPAARELRQYLAGQISSGAFQEYLLWIERDPDAVRRLLSAIGRAASDGELKDLLRLARRAFPDPR